MKKFLRTSGSAAIVLGACVAQSAWAEEAKLALSQVIPADGILKAQASDSVCVASFLSSPDLAGKDGARAQQILKDHLLNVSTWGTEQISILVLKSGERRARLLLAQAIRNEGLRVGLLRTNATSDRLEPVTAEKILAEEKFVVVADFPNTKEMRETDGARAVQILKDHDIEAVSAGSAGMSINVAARDEKQARVLLARAMIKEKLRIGLTRMNAASDRGKPVTPEEVLKEGE